MPKTLLMLEGGHTTIVHDRDATTVLKRTMEAETAARSEVKKGLPFLGLNKDDDDLGYVRLSSIVAILNVKER